MDELGTLGNAGPAVDDSTPPEWDLRAMAEEAAAQTIAVSWRGYRNRQVFDRMKEALWQAVRHHPHFQQPTTKPLSRLTSVQVTMSAAIRLSCSFACEWAHCVCVCVFTARHISWGVIRCRRVLLPGRSYGSSARSKLNSCRTQRFTHGFASGETAIYPTPLT
jgi:hypothetical protein